MKTTIKCFVHQYSNTFGQPVFQAYANNMSEYDGFVLVGEAEFEYDVPDTFNPTAAKITTLEKKLDAMKAEYQRNVATIRGQIGDLQCIEHSPAGAA
jgi:hypothetical protein